MSLKLPREVAGVRIPDGRLARLAVEYVRDVSTDLVFNHVLRTFFFGALLGEARGLAVDSELFFLGAAMHDLGQAEAFIPGPNRFEVEGADAAAAFLARNSAPREVIDVVWDAVALHSSVGIVDRKRPEISLVAAGAGLDVAGRGVDVIGPERVREICAAFPRPNFKRDYSALLGRIAAQKPMAAFGNFVADFGKRHHPEVRFPSVCDALHAAPFPE